LRTLSRASLRKFLKLRVEQIDLMQQVIHLDPGETKNDEGRTIRTTQEAYNLLTACIEGKEPTDLAITRQDGSPVGDFRRAWRSACSEAGVPRLRLHGLRRTGCRNMRRLGFDESVIMKVSGWKTSSVFRRYNIVDERDIAEVAAKLDEKRKKQFDDGHSSGIIEHPEQIKPENGKLN
jgi:integrase